MQNNTKPPKGTATTVPCKPLVAILGWAMDVYHQSEPSDIEEISTLLFETLISDDDAMGEERRAALFFHHQIKELCATLSQISKEEITALNHYVLAICQEQTKNAE